MCYPVHIKEPLLLIGKSSPCSGSGFPLSLSEWSFTICPMPYNHKLNVLRASINEAFPSTSVQIRSLLYVTRDANPVPIIPLTDDIATASLGPVIKRFDRTSDITTQHQLGPF